MPNWLVTTTLLRYASLYDTVMVMHLTLGRLKSISSVYTFLKLDDRLALGMSVYKALFLHCHL